MFVTYFFIYSLIFRYEIYYILTKKHNISNISLLFFFYFMKSISYSFWTIHNEHINIDGFN